MTKLGAQIKMALDKAMENALTRLGEEFVERAEAYLEDEEEEALMGTISYKVEKKAGGGYVLKIRVDSEDAPYIEFGSFTKEAHPFLQPVIDDMLEEKRIDKLIREELKKVL